MKETIRKNKGITLIALVITIVVLLILAAVSLNLVLGQNGIITRAKEARDKAGSSDAIFAIDSAYAACYLDQLGDESQITAEDFQEALRNVSGYESATVTLSGDTFTINANGKTYTKTISGETEEVGASPTITNVKVVANSDGSGDNLAAGSVDSSTTSTLYIMFTAATLEDGASISKIQVKENGVFTDTTLPYSITENGNYEFKAISTTGKNVTKIVNVNQFKLNIAQGAYIDYDAGSWTQTEITALGTLYSTSSTSFKFSGFEAGTSRNTTGWRVLKVNDDGSVLLISAGLPETYYHPGGDNNAYKTEYILNKNTTDENITAEIKASAGTPREWDMYANGLGAVEAHSITLEDEQLIPIYSSTFVVSNYWIAKNNNSSLWMKFSDGSGNPWNGAGNCSLGVRIIVKLQPGLVITGGTGADYTNRYTYTY